jgi:hypothetical protein
VPSVRIVNDKKLLFDAARVRENRMLVAFIVATSYQAVWGCQATNSAYIVT